MRRNINTIAERKSEYLLCNQRVLDSLQKTWESSTFSSHLLQQSHVLQHTSLHGINHNALAFGTTNNQSRELFEHQCSEISFPAVAFWYSELVKCFSLEIDPEHNVTQISLPIQHLVGVLWSSQQPFSNNLFPGVKKESYENAAVYNPISVLSVYNIHDMCENRLRFTGYTCCSKVSKLESKFDTRWYSSAPPRIRICGFSFFDDIRRWATFFLQTTPFTTKL